MSKLFTRKCPHCNLSINFSVNETSTSLTLKCPRCNTLFDAFKKYDFKPPERETEKKTSPAYIILMDLIDLIKSKTNEQDFEDIIGNSILSIKNNIEESKLITKEEIESFLISNIIIRNGF